MGKAGAVEEEEEEGEEGKWEVALSCPIFVHVEASAMEVVEEVEEGVLLTSCMSTDTFVNLEPTGNV